MEPNVESDIEVIEIDEPVESRESENQVIEPDNESAEPQKSDIIESEEPKTGGGGLFKHIDTIKEGTDCVLTDVQTCSLEPDIKRMKDYLENQAGHKLPINSDKKSVVDAMKEVLQVDSEAAIWENSKFRSWIGSSHADNVLMARFKTKGPNNSTDLLDNINIDDTLAKWAINGVELYKHKFYHVPFQMIDFESKGTELSKLDPWVLMKEGYDCFGVVLNTDVSTGRGKHWFCLFGDLKHKGTKEDPIQIEYFNSSGNPPMLPVDTWLEKTKYDLMRDHKIYCEIIRSVNKRLQTSQTECGVWSLLYIKSRLENKPVDWFFKVKADDADMIEYRKFLFRPE